MIRHIRREPKRLAPELPLRARVTWTLGNLLMLAGVYLLLYVGGIYTQIEYFRLAARGDSDLAAPVMLIDPPASPAPTTTAPFHAPVLANEGLVSGPVPDPVQAGHTAEVGRIVIPSIDVDSKVIEVGWRVEDQGGQPVAVWEVAEFAVGQHRGSANPGEGGNVVLAGHVGGYGKVFKDLFYVQPGEPITIYSGGQQFLYVVQDRLLLDEEGVPPEQRAANARYIAPTDYEVLTLITCWPPSGAERFSQRIIVRATPFGATLEAAQDRPSSWTVR